MTSGYYILFAIAGIITSAMLWARLTGRNDRLALVHVAALAGAFLGAKVIYLASEGWLFWNDPNRWAILATGKSITGALLGGYAAVEVAKKFLDYKGTTGDWFALIVPQSIMLGRVGCILNGCCLGAEQPESWFTVHDAQGHSRWPAAQLELGFNAVALIVLFRLRNQKSFRGQLFHIYLIAYGTFRFWHEFFRDTPKIAGPFSGYQIACLALILLGTIGFIRRRPATAVNGRLKKADEVADPLSVPPNRPAPRY